MISTLKPVADLVRSLPADKGFALIPNARVYEMYALMVYARLLDERVAKLARKHAVSVSALAGQEAALAAALVDLARIDLFAPGVQAVTAAGVKGLPPESIASLLAADGRHVPWKKHGLLPASLCLEDQIAETLTQAAALRKAGKKGMAVIQLGDPEPHAKLILKALKQAKEEKLPILFLVTTSLAKPEFLASAAKLELPSAVVDAADALAIYRVVTESAGHARRGNGPTLIECRPWPLAAAPEDPIEKMEQAMRRRNIYSASLAKKTAAAFRHCM